MGPGGQHQQALPCPRKALEQKGQEACLLRVGSQSNKAPEV